MSTPLVAKLSVIVLTAVHIIIPVCSFAFCELPLLPEHFFELSSTIFANLGEQTFLIAFMSSAEVAPILGKTVLI